MDKRSGFSYKDDLQPIVAGQIALPNFERKDLADTVNNIAACGDSMLAVWGWALHEGHKTWTMFFLTPTAMGNANGDHARFDGGGYALIYNSRKDGPIAGHFEICQHTKVDGPGANHSRGWHPGHCSKCGLDMSVDSGD